MTTPPAISPHHELELPGQTVIVIGGSAGIGLELSRREPEQRARRLQGAPAGCAIEWCVAGRSRGKKQSATRGHRRVRTRNQPPGRLRARPGLQTRTPASDYYGRGAPPVARR
jgi:hypothetical protein